ncbi:MAG: ABC transporter substrate-binding protein, partial [Chloroflexota bacterium]|nr:ABC transporter substrate-binding protein [Chloroflexota bacterium]
PTPTPTLRPGETPKPTPTPTATTAVPTPTPTSTPTAVPTPTFTPRPTAVAVPTSTPTPPQPVKPSGSLVYAYSGIGAPGYIPSREDTIPMLLSMNTFKESLFYDNGSGPKPMLAESWSTSADGKSWTFKLKKGIKWHDAEYGDVTAEDLIYSFQDAAIDTSRNVAAYMWRRITKYDSPDPYTLTISTDQPYNDLMTRLTYPYMGQLLVSSKKQRDKLGADGQAAHPTGTGAFRFVEFKTGEYLRVEAVENHWRKTPEAQRLTIMEVPEEITRLALLLTGKADIAQISITQLDALKGPNVKVISKPGGGSFFSYYGGLYLKSREGWAGNSSPWVGDYDNPTSWENAKKVRYAMSLAINRQQIVDTVFKGHGKPLVHRKWIGASQPPVSAKPDDYNPTLAKQLLAEAGVPKGYKITYRTSSDRPVPMNPQVAEAVAGYWRDVGFNVEMAVTTYAAVRPLVVGRKLTGHDMYQHNFGVTVSPELSWTDSTVTFPPYEVPWFESRVSKMLSETDQAKLAAWNKEALQYELDNHLELEIVEMDLIQPIGSKIASWELSGFDPVLGWELWNIKMAK